MLILGFRPTIISYFYHKNILKYTYPARKQFMSKFEIDIMEYGTQEEKNKLYISDETIEKMNKGITNFHNEIVTNDDTVHFLGDYAFYASQRKAINGEGQPYQRDDLFNMNGRFVYIRGNHDKNSNKFKPKIETLIINQKGIKIQCIHDPLYAKIDYDLILCGHVHNNWKIKELHYCGETRLIINVGADCWGMKPVPLDEILSIYHKWRGQRSKLKKWEKPLILKELNKGTLADGK